MRSISSPSASATASPNSPSIPESLGRLQALQDFLKVLIFQMFASEVFPIKLDLCADLVAFGTGNQGTLNRDGLDRWVIAQKITEFLPVLYTNASSDQQLSFIKKNATKPRRIPMEIEPIASQ